MRQRKTRTAKVTTHRPPSLREALLAITTKGRAVANELEGLLVSGRRSR